MSTYNNFKNTTIRGNFKNSDYADNSILASATFDRNVYVKGDLYLGNETSTTLNGVTTYSDTSGNIILKINGTTYTISPSDFIKVLNIPDKITLTDLSTYLTTTNNYIQSSYLTNNHYLQKTSADSYYLTKATADTYYQTLFTDVNGSFDPNLFLLKADASLNYVSKSGDITTSNNINLTSISNKINLNGTGTSIYDNGNFHLDTTNSMYVSAPTQLSIISPSTTFSGNVTIASGKSLTTPAISLNGYDLTTRLGEIVTAFGQTSMPKAGGTFTGDVTVAATKKLITPEITLNGSDLQGLLNLKAPLASPSFSGTVSGITSSMVGLGSVDNTSDANKPVSTATTTALNLKMDKSGGTFTGDINTPNNINLTGYAGKITFNTTGSSIYDDLQLRIKTDDQMYLSTGLGANSFIDFTSPEFKLNGTVNIKNTSSNLNFFKLTNNTKPTKYLDFYNYEPDGNNYMDIWNGSLNIRYVNGGYYNRIVVTSAGVDLTGTVTGVTSSMVGLGSVDNTSDANKPVSTATTTALNLKMDKSGGTFTGSINTASNINLTGTAGRIDFNGGCSKIYDDVDLHIETDDRMTLRAPTSLTIDTPSANFNGAVSTTGSLSCGSLNTGSINCGYLNTGTNSINCGSINASSVIYCPSITTGSGILVSGSIQTSYSKIGNGLACSMINTTGYSYSIFFSLKNFSTLGMNDMDDHWFALPGYRIIIYKDPNYTTGLYDLDNTGGSSVAYYNSSPSNNATSCKVYFLGVEITNSTLS